MDLTGKRVLVTGAAGGLGEAISAELAHRGASLVLSGRNADGLRALAQSLGSSVDEVVVADLASAGGRAALDSLAADLDGAVLNAGVSLDPPLASVTEADVDTVVDVNLRAPMQFARAFVASHLAGERPGALVMVGSVAGVVATPGLRTYNATKFGLRGFCLSLAQELHGTTVGVTHLAPGFVRDAGMLVNSGMTLPPGVRTCTPADVARAAAGALERGPTEVFVAPTEVRLAASAAGLLPNLGAAVQRRFATSRFRQGVDGRRRA